MGTIESESLAHSKLVIHELDDRRHAAMPYSNLLIDGNRLEKKVDTNVPITAHEIPSKYDPGLISMLRRRTRIFPR
jgi:hypothetical protein